MIVKGLIAALLSSSLLAAQKPAPVSAKAAANDGWKLTFSDEFEGSALEFPKWSPHDPWGKERNFEVQAYTPESVELRDGMARLVARVAKAEYDGHKRDYTSGMLTTFGSFAQQYGRFEIRCRVPVTQGVQAGLWLLPVPNGELPAIDIMNFLGRDPGHVQFGTFWGDTKTVRSYEGGWPVKDLDSAFHTYAVEWDEGKVVWFVDGVERFRSTSGIPTQPMYLAMSLAVGGEAAKWPDATTVFPAAFELDYVRIYKRQ
ncbi:MAG: glycoside hydrolase family 16 [Bryobacterales bacterium]|nr:glycoside hydrolase family 16 [Bryobacterales bacterium]